MKSMMKPAASFDQVLIDHSVGRRIFDYLDNIVYFVKDAAGRYVDVNTTLVRRCNASDKTALIGKTSAEIFPAPMGDEYLKQDLDLIATGTPLRSELERHTYVRSRNSATNGVWCLTTKLPVRDSEDRVVGLAGVSRDLHCTADDQDEEFARIADFVRYVKTHLDQPLRVSESAERYGMSPYQLDSRCRNVFGSTAAQLILRLRMESASTMLANGQSPIMEIALAVGYSDQSTFTRQFRKTFGVSPGVYRTNADSFHLVHP